MDSPEESSQTKTHILCPSSWSTSIRKQEQNKMCRWPTTHKQMGNQKDQINGWNNTYNMYATCNKTTGQMLYQWPNSPTTLGQTWQQKKPHFHWSWDGHLEPPGQICHLQHHQLIKEWKNWWSKDNMCKTASNMHNNWWCKEETQSLCIKVQWSGSKGWTYKPFTLHPS